MSSNTSLLPALTLVTHCAPPEGWYHHDQTSGTTTQKGMGVSLVLDAMRLSGFKDNPVNLVAMEDVVLNDSVKLYPFIQAVAFGPADLHTNTLGFAARRLPHLDYSPAVGFVNVVITSRKGLGLGYNANFFQGIFDDYTYALILASLVMSFAYVVG